MDDNIDKPVYTISATADILGISIHTLRMYEREGLILSYKKSSGHRLYSQEDIERIKCIRNAINESKISINGIKTIYSMIPCWKFINCNDEERENCPAYKSYSKPCWTFKHNDNPCSVNDCRNCPVYKDHSKCTSIKQKEISIKLKNFYLCFKIILSAFVCVKTIHKIFFLRWTWPLSTY